MVLEEHSRARSRWDLLVLILALVSCVLIPYQVAIEHEVDFLGSVLVYALDVFFLVDIVLNFRTSFHRHGAEVRDENAIRRRYLRTLFPIDLAATIPFDLLLLVWGGSSSTVVSTVLLLRLLRLLRVVRVIVIFGRWLRQGSTNAGFLRIVRLATFALLLMHWISCAWFFVPFLEGFPADSWVASQRLEEASPGTQYIRSLYWTVVTMTTVGYGDITPARNFEYAFTILVMLAGASLYAFIIGNIASLLSNLDAAKVAFWNSAEAANQYLRSRRVPDSLNERVRAYYEYMWARYHGLASKDLFAELPESIRIDIVRHVTGELLEGFPLFQEAPKALQDQLLLALVPRVFVPGDFLLREGEEGEEIFFLSRGNAEVRSARQSERHATVSSGDYFGDLSMLLGEKRTGSVVATSYCEVFVLKREDFDRIRTMHPEFRDLFVRAASMRRKHSAALLLEDVVL